MIPKDATLLQEVLISLGNQRVIQPEPLPNWFVELTLEKLIFQSHDSKPEALKMIFWVLYSDICNQQPDLPIKSTAFPFPEPAQIPAEPTYPSQHEIFWCVFGGVLHWKNSHVFGEYAPDAYALRWIAWRTKKAVEL